ncbi:caspase family protein [Amphritea sp.]|uniref:caspase family protein n=1 Tax=Amphritea sp. TaxID=1872502 RepID=UPI0025B89B27|nr:caspase family protein [Amphritea sp.]
MRLITLIIALLLNISTFPAFGNQANSRIFLAQSLQHFNPLGDPVCDDLLTQGLSFPMEAASVESIKACRSRIKVLMAESVPLLFHTDGTPDEAMTGSMANLFAWDSLLMYWIGQLDFEDPDGNIFFASQSAYQAINYLKLVDPEPVTLARFQLLAMALYVKSQMLSDIEKYESAYQKFLNIHDSIAQDSDMFSGLERLSLRAYSAYWLGILNIHNQLSVRLLETEEQRKQTKMATYRFLQEAYETETNENVRLEYLLTLARQFQFESPPTEANIFSREVLVSEIENSAANVDNIQLKVWNLIDQARRLSYDVKSVGDAADIQLERLLDQAERISEKLNLHHYLTDIVVLRLQIAITFSNQDRVEVLLERQAELMHYISVLVEEKSPQIALWTNRYFQLIDTFGQALIMFNDHERAVDFFTTLESQGLVSAALNLSALHLQKSDYLAAIKVLTDISSDLSGDQRVVYRHNLSLAKHLSGDISGAIALLSDDDSPSDIMVAYQAALYAFNRQDVQAITLIKKHAGVGYGAFAQSLNRTALAIYSRDKTNAAVGSIINPLQPLYSFADEWIYSSTTEKSGFSYFQGPTELLSEDRATLVAGLGGDSISYNSLLSFTGNIAALASGNQITLWGADNGLPFRRLTSSGSVEYMDFLHDDQHLLVQSSDNLLTLWNLATGESIYTLPTDSNVWKAFLINHSKDTVLYMNAYSQLVEMDLFDPAKNRSITAASGSRHFTIDDKGERLFFVRGEWGENTEWNEYLVSYDLEEQSILDQTRVTGVLELNFLTYKQQLLIISSDDEGYKLNIWNQNVELSEGKPLFFSHRVNVIRGSTKGKKLRIRGQDADKILDLDLLSLETFSDSSSRRLLHLSAHTERALLHKADSNSLQVVDFMTMQPIATLKRQESDPGVAFYDEERERLLVSSGYNRLHIWDMSTGQELLRREQSPVLNPDYINGQLIAIADNIDAYALEGNQWGYFGQGEFLMKSLPVPEDILNNKLGAELQTFESNGHVYFSALDIYYSEHRKRRVWRSDLAMTQAELLPWSLVNEKIVAISEQKQRLITEDGSRVIIRALDDGVMTSEISVTENYGGLKDIRVAWVDVQHETIWIELDNRLVAYNFNGVAIHRFADELGRLIDVDGHHELPYFIASYEVSGSTLLRQVSRETGAVLRSDILVKRVAENINFSSQANYLLVSTEVGSIEFWSLGKNKALFSMYLLPDNTWAVIDPRGRFDTNNLTDLDYLAWRLPQDPMKSYPVDIFLRDFYEPRLIPRLLNDAPFSPIPNLSLINRWQPEINISQVTKNSRGKLSVTVELEQGEWPDVKQARAYDLRLFRDGQQVAVFPKDHGEIVFNSSGTQSVLFEDIALPNLRQGQHVKLTAIAFNSDGVKSQTAHYSYTQAVDSDRQPARAFIVNIGIDHYSDTAWNLAFAGNDAKLLASTLTGNLRNSEAYQSVHQQVLTTRADRFIDKTQVRSVLDALATNNGAENQFDYGLHQSTPNDTIIITWSGHGYVNQQGEFYLLTSELGQGGKDMNALLEGAVSVTELSTWIEGIDANRFILIIDACHSAAAVESGEFKPGPMGSKGFGQLAWYKGMQILTASQANDVALESSLLEHGLLTYSLVNDGLVEQQADFLPADGILSASEWLKYGQHRVPEIYRLLKAGNTTSFKTSRGVVRKNIPRVENVQMPGLFDFYRGDQEMQLQVNRQGE